VGFSYLVFSTSVGEVLVAGNSVAVTHVRLGGNRISLIAEFLSEYPDASVMAESPYLMNASNEILQFINGSQKTMNVVIAPEGTEMQRKVWHELRQIAFGTTITYTELARRMDQPKAVRAVANACGANPISLIIPCHRVVRMGGDLGGYRWGIARKQLLLDLERARTSVALAA
jgi:AraC family transcriptional regulator of adaptative response/methylated-DNA-[protein]-cysteine methyltransferase